MRQVERATEFLEVAANAASSGGADHLHAEALELLDIPRRRGRDIVDEGDRARPGRGSP